MAFPIDPDYLRNNVDKFEKMFEKRGLDKIDIHRAIDLDNRRRELQRELDRFKHRKNVYTKAYGIVLQVINGKLDKNEAIRQINSLPIKVDIKNFDNNDLQKIKKEIDELDNLIKNYENEFYNVENSLINLLWRFPNLISDEVPVGDESKNTPIRFWGIPRVFDLDKFKEQTEKFGYKIVELKEMIENKNLYIKYIKNIELLKELYDVLTGKKDFVEINFNDALDFNLLNQDKIVVYVKIDKEWKHQYDLLKELKYADTDKAGEVAGSRFYFEFNLFALLDLSLSLYGIKFLIKKGYKFIIPPYMLREKILRGIITLDDFQDMMYKIENDDLYLIGTAEHPVTALYYNEIIEEKELPIKIVSWSPCFRREAGAHGKDTKGLFRLHQFHKVEQYVFSKPEESEKYHQEIIKNAEEFLQTLNIPYRTVIIASRDMGKRNYKQYDIEGWFPGQQSYRELVSGSNVTDWQSRRSNIRYRKSDGSLDFVHTLNCTLVAVQRTLSCLLENNFDIKNNKFVVPSVLKNYL